MIVKATPARGAQKLTLLIEERRPPRKEAETPPPHSTEPTTGEEGWPPGCSPPLPSPPPHAPIRLRRGGQSSSPSTPVPCCRRPGGNRCSGTRSSAPAGLPAGSLRSDGGGRHPRRWFSPFFPRRRFRNFPNNTLSIIFSFCSIYPVFGGRFVKCCCFCSAFGFPGSRRVLLRRIRFPSERL